MYGELRALCALLIFKIRLLIQDSLKRWQYVWQLNERSAFFIREVRERGSGIYKRNIY